MKLRPWPFLGQGRRKRKDVACRQFFNLIKRVDLLINRERASSNDDDFDLGLIVDIFKKLIFRSPDNFTYYLVFFI